MTPPYLDPDLIAQHLPPAPEWPDRLVPRIQVYAETASTNNLAWRLGQDGAPAGHAIFAERQTQGRGTRGRSWASAEGRALCFSLLLRPDLAPTLWTRLTPATGVAVARTLEWALGPADSARLGLGIKWANDVYLAGRKVCGILAEASLSGPQTFLVLGVGLNVLQERTDFSPELAGIATSLQAELAAPLAFTREELAGRLLGEIFRTCADCETEHGYARILEEYRARNWLLGRRVVVEQVPGEDAVEGLVTGIGPVGELLLEVGGQAQSILSGTVRLVEAPAG